MPWVEELLCTENSREKEKKQPSFFVSEQLCLEQLLQQVTDLRLNIQWPNFPGHHSRKAQW